MEEIQNQEITMKDILKHYLSSIFIYGVILLAITFCPAYSQTVENPHFNYVIFFLIYYIGYVIFALPIYVYKKPTSLLNSRSITVINYFKRQFNKKETTEEWLSNIEPNENEKQALTIFFMQTFFGTYCINLLCNKFLPSLEYKYQFLKEMFVQAWNYTHSAGLFLGTIQYIDDTSDMWLSIIIMLTLIVYAFSYLSDTVYLKNKIKSIDTTPLGIISNIICFFPVTILTNKIIITNQAELMPVENITLRTTLNVLIVLANLIGLIAILRLGTRCGNLTNRGIVTGFPYNIVRHPSYIMEACYIFLTAIPIFFIIDYTILEKILMGLGALIYIFVLYLRAITEERHLIKDPEYKEYIEKVKYRFIPKLF